VDPHAENYFRASPYAYVENNPISRIDPDGRDWYYFDGQYQWRRSQDETYTDDDGNEWKNVGTRHMVAIGNRRILFDQTTNDDGELVLTSMSFENRIPTGGAAEQSSVGEAVFGLLADGLSEGLQGLGMGQGSAELTAGITMLASSFIIGKPKFISKLPIQRHHFATNKHSVYTKQMSAIARRHGLDLDGAWNTTLMHHVGRHPHEYHRFVLQGMERASIEAGGNQARFLQLFDLYVKQPILQNPSLLRKSGW
jgi:hypothetical protein